VPATALALALAAAALHAGWNILIARAGDPEGAGAAAILIGVVAFAPVAALTWQVEWSAVPYIGASAAFELAYFALLAAAYRRYDLSVVYPIARGAAPVLVLVVAVVATSAQASALEVAAWRSSPCIMLVRGVHGGGWAARRCSASRRASRRTRSSTSPDSTTRRRSRTSR
jgi:multidrug transporter EmrE-like cation transporter